MPGPHRHNPKNRNIRAAKVGFAGFVSLVFFCPPAGAQSQIADRRVALTDDSIAPSLAKAANSLAFIDVPTTRPGAPIDGGTAILVADCLLLTADHVVDALIGRGLKAPIRARFASQFANGSTATSPENGGKRKTAAYTALVEARGGAGLWRDPVSDDWALLRLTEKPSLPPLALAEPGCCDWQRLPVPTAVAGFPGDKIVANQPMLWIDPACTIVRRLAIPVFATNCQATSGNSGGPVLVETLAGWAVAAMLTRAPAPGRRGLVSGQSTFALALDGRIARAISRASKLPCPANMKAPPLD